MKSLKYLRNPREAANLEKLEQENLLKITHFNQNEIIELQLIYRKLTDTIVNGKKCMSLNRVKKALWNWLDMSNMMVITKIISKIEPEAKKHLTETGWLKLLSLLLRGEISEKMDICFYIYDKYYKEYLTRDVVEEYILGTIKANSLEEAEEVATEMTAYFFEIFDCDRDGVISYEDYRQVVLRMPDLLECFGRIFPPRETIPSTELIILKNMNIFK